MFKESSFEKMQAPEPEPESKKEKSEAQIKFEKDKEEMEKIEAAIRPEIEAKFKNALESLYTKIQSIQETKKDFPSRTKLEELIEEIPVFAKLAEGAKKMFIGALQIKKEFRSPNPEVFIEKGMEILGLFIHTETLKRGGEIWLQGRLEQGRLEQRPEGTEKIPETKEGPEET